MVRISFIDTGIGIAEEFISKLFIPFERIGAENTNTEGTGLGLSVVKKLIEIMAGNLGVESTPQVGSTFWIELPLSESQSVIVKNRLIQSREEKDLPYKKGTILYIEDNQSNIELVEQILEDQRPNVKLITSLQGQMAVQLAIIHRPKIILLDLNLPDLSGGEVLELLHANNKTKDIPVVVVSADAMPVQIDKLLAAGAKSYLTKPLDISQFVQIIDQFIC